MSCVMQGVAHQSAEGRMNPRLAFTIIAPQVHSTICLVDVFIAYPRDYGPPSRHETVLIH